MNHFLRVAVLSFALALIGATNVNATKYTSIASGNFSASGTWSGGIVPPTITIAGDTIVIASGHDVILDNDLTLTNTSNLLDVQGTLRTTTAQYIAFNGNIHLFISGTLDVDSIVIVNTNFSNISGQMTVKKMRWLAFTPSGSGKVTITEHLHLLGPLNTANGCTVDIGNNAIINMRGGSMPLASNINFPASYDVTYTFGAYSQPTGKELDAAGLRHVTIDINDTTELKLGGDMNIDNGNLTLLSGTLSLNNHHLTISNNGDVAATGIGRFKSSSSSNITITNMNGISSELKFRTGGNTIGTLTINAANGATVKLGSEIKVTDKIDFQNGKIDVQGYKLSLITGANITGADAGKYIITGSTGALATDIGAGNTFLYPIGTSAHYLPVTVTSNNNTVYNGISARVNPEVKTMGLTGSNMALKQPMVNATWFIEHANTSVDLNIEIVWDATLETTGFNRNIAYISHFEGANWDKISGKAATSLTNNSYSIKREGIKSLSPFAIFDNNTVDIQDATQAYQVTIYPNPATNTLYTNVKEATLATIHNINGQVMSTTQLDINHNTINISLLPQGVYYLKLANKQNNTYSKFIKQ